MTIFIIGFMGAGKTTFGKKLAAKLNFAFTDLDEAVLQFTKSPSLKTLIEEKEIRFFREAETKTLKQLALEDRIISTGGGTPCYFDNMGWMKSKGVVVFLNLEEGVLFSRLKNTDLEERPLLQDLDEEGLRNFIHAKLEERMPFYSQAHLTFNPVNQKMDELLTFLNRFG